MNARIVLAAFGALLSILLFSIGLFFELRVIHVP